MRNLIYLLTHPLRFVTTLHKRQDGQVLVLAAFSMVMVLGFTALAVDIGFFARAKRDLQNDADAMALAGAQEIPDQGLADGKAREWATRNAVDGDEVESIVFGTTCSGGAEPNTITVRLQRGQPTFFARVLGITSSSMYACATAGRYSVTGFVGAAPWGIEDDCIWGPDGQPDGVDDIAFGEIITLKYDADNTGEDCDSHTGNFGALAIDDTGAGQQCGDDPGDEEARKYGDAICWGSITPLEEGDYINTETGNIISRTRDSVEYLFDNVSEECDEWGEIVDVATETLKADCNPLYGGRPSIVLLIPIVDGLWETSGGSEPVEIVSFVFVVLEPPPPGNWCTGASCDISARFVENATVPVGVRGTLDPDSSITTVALIE